MYNRFEKTRREHRFLNDAKNPSFSSTLLDKIYRSIDEGERKSGDMKQSRINAKFDRAVEEEEELATANLRRARLLEKWMDRKVSEKVGTTKMDRKSHHDHDHDQDVLFFSSNSSSSESSNSGLLSSSSDTESMYGVRSRVSCFAPSRPKPVKTSVSERTEKTHEEGLIKSKSRALKIYNNLKKVKQPISPGGKLTNFLNSLFTTGNTKKTKATLEDVNAERKAKSGQASTCSSASSFSRSCLSKTSPSSRDKLRNGAKRTVSFYPVSVIVDEDCRPCGHKCLYEGEDTSSMNVSMPTARKIGRSTPKKNEEEVTRVEAAAREFLKEYHRNQKKSDLILKDIPMSTNEEDEDDTASYSSEDLFELDHLTVMGNNRYFEELPVYETTHFSTNRAIANGLMM
ncbi:protein BIG GRAIN 1-like B [Gastrolobium bilobum]|uniref:protein BIG GRAIN 1-like B n=1 Tax=Gastrolobium bilobum TaxID=150636 RepID=UPI002AB0A9D4|nr:protein BIG GRAIN 1-like B [Gastrolobium bilobum]